VRALVVLPSYNERENIASLVDALLDADPEYLVCVVDDSSPDGTSEMLARAIADKEEWRDRTHLITRSKKDGRGGAVRDGLIWGTVQQPIIDAFVEMDCDFSHEPGVVPRGLALLAAGNDVVIGARYPNGTIIGWPRRRRVFSALANWLARHLIDPSVGDYTNGFRFYSRAAVTVLLDHPQRHKGYIYLSESLSHLLRAGMRVQSFPIVFVNRQRGESNTGPREVWAALTGIVSIAWAFRRSGG
jgi:glycosyltransferase involved in cell wall biosynthesis